MKVVKHSSHITYEEGNYSIEVYKKGDMYLKHKCSNSNEKETFYDHILPNELKNNKCRYCYEFDIPESIQALYYLYRAGRPNKVYR